MTVARVGGLVAVGVAGWVGGVGVERWRRGHGVSAATPLESRAMESWPWRRGHGVSAATPLESRAMVARDIEVPAEPPEGSSRVGQIMRFGFPGLDNIRSHKDYIVSYDRRNRVPHWVFEHLTKESIARTEGVDRSQSEFRPDESMHKFFRSTNKDYKYSGYDRGHLAPAGNHRRDQTMLDQTFLLSNMAPQVGQGFNRDKWEHLERYVRRLTKLYRNVYVCTGPLYLPRMEDDGKMYVKYQVIGANNVAVPTHFFKVVLGETDERELDMMAFVLPNKAIPDNVPLENFLVPPDSVEPDLQKTSLR